MNTNQAFLLLRELAAKREHVLDKNQIAVAVALVDLVDRVAKLENRTVSAQNSDAAAAAFDVEHQRKLDEERARRGLETWEELKAERDALKIERDALRENLKVWSKCAPIELKDELERLRAELDRYKEEKQQLQKMVRDTVNFLSLASERHLRPEID